MKKSIILKSTIFFLLFQISNEVKSQIPLEFLNPSFEGVPTSNIDTLAQKQLNWLDCSSIEFAHTPAYEVQPGYFDVELEAFHGDTYFSLVTRANGSYKGICQQLSDTLLRDSVYQFFIYLAKSSQFSSAPWIFDDPSAIDSHGKVAYNEDAILRVWGGVEPCTKDLFLYETEPVNHKYWKSYEVVFTALRSDIKYIIIEAYFPVDSKYTRSNLLIDFVHSK